MVIKGACSRNPVTFLYDLWKVVVLLKIVMLLVLKLTASDDAEDICMSLNIRLDLSDWKLIF